MNANYQRFLLVLATFVVAGVIAVPFLRLGKPTVTKDTPTLPLGLLLEKRQGKLTVVEAMEDATAYGLERKDILQMVDGFAVGSVAQLRGALKEKSSGDQISMVVERGDTMLTINRRFRGELEVPSASGTVYRVADVARPEKGERTSQAPRPTTSVSQTKVMTKTWADFGMYFKEGNGRLIVKKLKPNSAAEAYGVLPDDVVFQVDKWKITSLSDFRRITTEKFAGDTANIMLVRGDSVIIIQDMKLGATNSTVKAPENYAAQIYPFASLKKEALETLLTNPFDFVPSAETLSVSIETDESPDLTTVGQSTADESVSLDLNTPLPTEEFVAGRETSDDASTIDIDALDPEYSRTTPSFETPELNGGQFSQSSSANGSGAGQRSAFSDLAQNEPSSPLRLKKPNAIPRFNKYSGIQLRHVPDEDGKFVQRPGESVTDAEQDDLNEQGVVGGMKLSNPQAASEVIGQTPRKPRDGPVSVKVESKQPIKSVLTTQSSEELPSPGDTNNQSKIVDNTPVVEMQTPSDRNQQIPASRDAVQPSQSPNYSLNSSAPVNTSPVSSSPSYSTSSASYPSPVHPAPSYSSPSQPSQGFGGGFYGSSFAVGVSHAPTYNNVECQACGDWGCSQCEFGGPNPDILSLDKLLYGDAEPVVSVGGWFSTGYHSESNDLFNNRPDSVALHQGWLYAEKLATQDSPLGFRADVMYGIDAADTQSFGNNIGTWDFDNGFDHGSYGWALPQLYAEVALGEWNIKAGHFFTLVGYEVVTAPNNFFYSHAITMYNSEPFTHTGVLASRSIGENLEIFAGWTLGWDTGFDQFNGGSSWLGGFSYSINEDASFTYVSTAGNFGARGDDAYSHSMVLDLSLTDDLSWVVQSDYLRVGGTGEDNVGVNQYITYSVSDKLGIGARMEWWKGDVLTGYAPHGGVLPADGSLSYYAATFGVNIRPVPNVILRPEVRKDWSPSADYDETYFGMDAIIQF